MDCMYTHLSNELKEVDREKAEGVLFYVMADWDLVNAIGGFSCGQILSLMKVGKVYKGGWVYGIVWSSSVSRQKENEKINEEMKDNGNGEEKKNFFKTCSSFPFCHASWSHCVFTGFIILFIACSSTVTPSSGPIFINLTCVLCYYSVHCLATHR